MWLNSWLNSLRQVAQSACRSNRRKRKSPGAQHLTSTELLESRALLSATANNVLLFSLEGGSALGTLPSVGTVDGSDLLSYDGANLGLYFQGSDVGLGSADIDAFALIDSTQILMSFSSSVSLTGIGTIDASDVVLFSATSLGANTAGSFSMFFDGSLFGLGSAASANVDAVEYLDNGHLLISTSGDYSVPSGATTLSFSDEDILEFTPTGPGPVTSGTWSLYFDGSDVQLTLSTEDVDALAVDANGRLFLSTVGSFFATTFGGDNEDVVEFSPTSLGDTTAGTYVQPLFFDGSAVAAALTPLNLDALDLLVIPPNSPPTADAQVVSTNEDASVAIQLTGDDGDANVVQALSFTLVSGPSHGTLTGFNAATGQVTYTPHANYNGPDSFTFIVTDVPSSGSALSSASATVTIGVAAVNDAPTANAQSVSTDEDQQVAIQLTGDDGDSGTTQPLVFAIASGPSHGTLTGFNSSTGQVTYTPSANYNGPDSFTFIVTDSAGSGAALASGVATVTLGVAAVNDAPTMTSPSDEQQGQKNKPLKISGLSVSDADAQQGNGILELRLTVKSGRLTVNASAAGIQSVTGNETGTIVLRGTQAGLNAVLAGGVQYFGGTDFTGLDTLNATVNDLGNTGAGGAKSAACQVNIRISAQSANPLTALRSEVSRLVESGVVSKKVGNSLLAKLNLKGDKSDVGRLGAFILQTRALQLSGRLTPEQAKSLISQARALLAPLLGANPWRPNWTSFGGVKPNSKLCAVDKVFTDYHFVCDRMAGLPAHAGK